jgi:hypothetical protein
MATQTLARAQYCGGPARIVSLPEAASQSFKQGQFVYLASGKVTVCADDATTIYGLAMQDASGTTDTAMMVMQARDDTEFLMNAYHATPSSAVTAVTQVGVKYGLEVDSNRCYVDISQTGADALIINEIMDAVGDTYGRVKASVIAAAQQRDAIAT